MRRYLNWAVVKFLLFVVCVYSVFVVILTHIPQILALVATMGVVHWLLKPDADRKDTAK